jgi:hypothetical protein
MDGSLPSKTTLAVNKLGPKASLKKRAYEFGCTIFDRAYLRAETSQELFEMTAEDFAEAAELEFGFKRTTRFAAEYVEDGYRDSLQHNGWPRAARWAV